MSAGQSTRLPYQDRSGNNCLWPFRSLVTWLFPGVHSAGAGVPPKQ